jgi:hypothetical protein
MRAVPKAHAQECISNGNVGRRVVCVYFRKKHVQQNKAVAYRLHKVTCNNVSMFFKLYMFGLTSAHPVPMPVRTLRTRVLVVAYLVTAY